MPTGPGSSGGPLKLTLRRSGDGGRAKLGAGGGSDEGRIGKDNGGASAASGTTGDGSASTAGGDAGDGTAGDGGATLELPNRTGPGDRSADDGESGLGGGCEGMGTGGGDRAKGSAIAPPARSAISLGAPAALGFGVAAHE